MARKVIKATIPKSKTKKELEAIENQINTGSKIKNDLGKSLNSMQKEVSVIQKNIETLKKQEGLYFKSNLKAKEDFNESLDVFKKKEKELDKISNLVVSLIISNGEQVEEHEIIIKELNDVYNKKKEEYGLLKTKNSELCINIEKNKKELANNNNLLLQEIERKENIIKGKDEKIKSLDIKILDINKDINDFNNKIINLNNDVDFLINTIKNKNKELRELKEECAKEIKSLNIEINKVNKEKDKLDEKISNYKLIREEVEIKAEILGKKMDKVAVEKYISEKIKD